MSNTTRLAESTFFESLLPASNSMPPGVPELSLERPGIRCLGPRLACCLRHVIPSYPYIEVGAIVGPRVDSLRIAW